MRAAADLFKYSDSLSFSRHPVAVLPNLSSHGFPLRSDTRRHQSLFFVSSIDAVERKRAFSPTFTPRASQQSTNNRSRHRFHNGRVEQV